MKNYILYTFLLLLLAVPVGISAQTVSWYNSFTGTIGTYPVTFHLHKMGHKLAGYYYYHSKMQPIYMIGEDSSGGAGKIKLYGYGPEEIITLSIKNNVCTGEWKKSEESKTGLPVKATAKPISPTLRFEMIYTRGSVKLRPKLPESPEGSYEAASIWPKGASPTDLFLKRTINEIFGDKNSQLDIGKRFLTSKKDFIASYMEEYKDVADSDLGEYSASYNMDETQWLLIAFQSTKLLTLANWNFSYTGGAHGNYYTSYMNIDLTTNKEILLREVLNSSGIQQLNPLLEKYFRKDKGLKSSEDLTEGGLFENKIEANENFYLTTKGIGFSYAPYEIGPYAAGEINVFIPFTELNAYLQPKFKKLIGP